MDRESIINRPRGSGSMTTSGQDARPLATAGSSLGDCRLLIGARLPCMEAPLPLWQSIFRLHMKLPCTEVQQSASPKSLLFFFP